MCSFSPYIPLPTSLGEAILSDEKLLIRIACLLLSHLSALGDGSSPLCLHGNSSVISFAGKVPIFGEAEATHLKSPWEEALVSVPTLKMMLSW